MTAIPKINYLFDPLCGWCYGASPTIKTLVDHGGFSVVLMPTGLFSNQHAPRMDDGFAAYAWANDQRIAKLTGQSFSAAYRDKVLSDRKARLDSGPATLALTAVSLTAPDRELEALRAIQTARYVEGRDITSTGVLAEILTDLTLHDASDMLLASGAEVLQANRSRVDAAQALMRRFGADGVPVLVVGEGQHQRLITANGIFGDKALVARLAGKDAARAMSNSRHA